MRPLAIPARATCSTSKPPLRPCGTSHPVIEAALDATAARRPQRRGRRLVRCLGYVGAGLAFALLGGCAAVGPDYDGPPPTTVEDVAAWPTGGAEGVTSSEPAERWWQSLGDADLDALIEAAMAANYDLRIAVANVEAARAVLDAVDTRKRPRVDFNASVQERRDSSALIVIADSDNRFPTVSRGSFGLDLSWEVDLFGRVRRSIEAAAAELGSLEAVRNGVMVAVLAQVARAYVDLRGAQSRLEVAARNVDVQRQTLDLVSLLTREGAATELDIARARTLLLTSESTIPSLRAAARAALNRLTTLTGRAPGALGDSLGTGGALPGMPDFVAAGAPADLLRRRPDVRAAERALAAASARIGVATADLFPTVTFGANVGVGSAPLSGLSAAGAPFFGAGPQLNWNLFDRSAIWARIRQVDSAAAVAMARYEATVTTALEEVDTALNAWTNERERRARLAAARDASRDAWRLAQLRYREGVEDFLTVLDAERSLLAIEDQLAVSEIALAQRLVDIHLALGGGWETATAPPHLPYDSAE